MAVARLVGLLLLLLSPAGASAERIFYRGETWLETSPGVQHLSLVGVLRAWERVSGEARRARAEGKPLSGRQREALRLQECLEAGPRRSTPELLRVVTGFAAREPERVFYSLSDFVAEGLKDLCADVETVPARDAARPDGDAALRAAADRGDAAAVARLLEQGASVHAADERGVTALIAAAYRNHLEVARLLIRAGADVNRQDATRQSAYLIATSDGHLELLRLTLQVGADVHRTDSYDGTGLIRAADRGHVEIVRELLKTGIRVDHVNRLGWTALLEAIILGDGGLRHTEVVRLLVEAGADVNLADGGGVTPLAHARRRGFARIIPILEKAGAR